MRTYIPSPDLTRPMGSDVPLVIITTADNVCSDDAYTVRFPHPEHRFTTALQLTFTDEEADEFLEKFAEARAARLKRQEETYEALHAKFGGTWDNALHDDFEPRCGEGIHRFYDGACRDCGDGIDGSLDGE